MTKTLDPKAVITTSQACKLLGITRQTLYLWMEKGKVKPWMMVAGATWLFEREDIEMLKPTRYQRQNGHQIPLKKMRR
ncbi:MAG: helix-turn-helix domain-containing protein [Elusimicrobiota bacterium]